MKIEQHLEVEISLKPKKTGDTYLHRCCLNIEYESGHRDEVAVTFSSSGDGIEEVAVNSEVMIGQDNSLYVGMPDGILPDVYRGGHKALAHTRFGSSSRFVARQPLSFQNGAMRDLGSESK